MAVNIIINSFDMKDSDNIMPTPAATFSGSTTPEGWPKEFN